MVKRESKERAAKAALPVAIVDVDETIWSFHTPVWKLAAERGIRLPPTSKCDHWDALYVYSTKKEVFKLFNEVHAHQSIYPPYPDARRFLCALRQKYYVIIASHRKKEYKPELIQWLYINNLPYDDVHVSSDKAQLFGDPNVRVVIDDKGETLCAALAKGKIAVGLKKPWNINVKYENGDLNLFKTLEEIEKFLGI